MNIFKNTKLYSYAKINLFLNIVSKRQNGYHDIQSVMQTVNIRDEIMIKYADEGIKISCDDEAIPVDSSNTVWKAASLIMERYGLGDGVSIDIKKTIPSGAGLAGGSGNAAAVIIGMNEMFDLSMTDEEMAEIAVEIGADVPYCLVGGTCIAEGIGEELERINDFSWDNILIVKPEISISTANVYGKVEKHMFNRYDMGEIVNRISGMEYREALSFTGNILEDIVEEIHPEIKEIKNAMTGFNALLSMMTGSGSAVVGFFENEWDLDKCAEALKKRYDKIYKTKTVKKGVELCMTS
ncbi:4-diphosphocytidyl-2-C-methyl-D-erythritol kinase [Dethiosulfatibacter aminovorans DSM 17477]|uniref:4-diphosphocytidyl-2-C-methyl-D-erythritol kinase n=1 Tax=Dethiosulfatibacter aminovorans DSM 17477 TaxID=1121476 RepID=A0A1M6J163_9FIRM|nr:4-(cytidine 5'-diphospho)-2-C-methyl-D-erythritol kinase [Dethiosulfatibacter aminovorans]SHJ40430.1 4-diphosphocytidyl-2-C-methyl-D-erythritol kinase [Dethiosulfatibacter aminovorans DSM 17477]